MYGCSQVITDNAHFNYLCSLILFSGSSEYQLDQDIDDNEFQQNKSETAGICLGNTSNNLTNHLSKEEQAICERAFLIFQGESDKIAQAINATTDSVSNAISSMQLELKPPIHVRLVEISKKRKGRSDHYQSMKNYNTKWLANIQSCEIHPAFMPCDHIEPCNEETCSCVQNKFFCNKACAWGSKSKNFFRGCACKAGQCRSSSCSCWAGKFIYY